MKNLNLITILISVSSLSVQAAANTKGTETNTVTIPEKIADENYLKQLYFVQVDPTLLDKTWDISSLINKLKMNEVFSDKNHEVFRENIDKLDMTFLTNKLQQLNFDSASFHGDYYNNKFTNNLDKFYDFFDKNKMNSDKKDELKNYLYKSTSDDFSDEYSELRALGSMPNLLKSYKFPKEITKLYGDKVEIHLKKFNECATEKKTIQQCIKPDGVSYETIMKDFKTWLFAKQMTEGPAEPEKRIQKEFIRPDWKDLAKSDKLNLKVATIPESLNYQYLCKVENLDPDTAIKSMLSKLDNLIETFNKDKASNDGDKLLYLNDLRLRYEFLKLISTSHVITNLDDIKGPVRAIERYAQGVYRALSIDPDYTIPLEVTSNIFKLWLMSLQMFEENGWKNNKYVKNLIQIPKDWKLTIDPTATTTVTKKSSLFDRILKNPNPSE